MPGRHDPRSLTATPGRPADRAPVRDGLRLALLIVGLGLGSFSAHAADPEPHVRYRVTIDAPRSLKDTLTNSLDLVRWQDFEDLTPDVLDRLLREALEQVREAAATDGYFSPTVSVVPTPGGAGEPIAVKVTVVPGEPTLVTAVGIEVDGPARDDPLGQAAIARLTREWQLGAGIRFRQSAWEDAKVRALSTLQASPFPAARVTASEARIDPAAHAATLTLKLESGPPFNFGEIVVEGMSKYPPSLVTNYSTLVPGEPYTAERLEEFVRRLQSSDYFASVQARIDADPAEAAAAPVRVAVIEAPRRRIETGIAYSTDTRIRGDFRYTDVNFADRAWKLDVLARADTKVQNFSVGVTLPPSERGYIDHAQASLERTDISGLLTRSAVVGVRRQTLEERNLTAYALSYYEDDQIPDGGEARRARALYAELSRSWRTVDDLIAPTRGTVLTMRVGGALPGLATRGFARAVVQAAVWRPWGLRNTLEARAEGGMVFAESRSGIPSPLLFRTGGDTTVRGYTFDSLGVSEGDATVPGRVYALVSVEAAHYFTESLGVAAFVDLGNAADTVASWKPAAGYGLGLRVKSPIGPFRADVAYGQDTHAFRLHMSVGLAF